MEHKEKVAKICEKMEVDEFEADAALRACGDDILDAALYLEALGKVKRPAGGYYTEIPENVRATEKAAPQRYASESFGEFVKRLLQKFVNLVKLGMHNYLQVRKNGESKLEVPITIFVILLLLPSCPIVLALMLISLFCDYSYRFVGENLNQDNSGNRISESCSRFAESVRKDWNESKQAQNTGNDETNA